MLCFKLRWILEAIAKDRNTFPVRAQEQLLYFLYIYLSPTESRTKWNWAISCETCSPWPCCGLQLSTLHSLCCFLLVIFPSGITAGGSCLKETTILLIFQAYRKTCCWFLRFTDAGFCWVISLWKENLKNSLIRLSLGCHRSWEKHWMKTETELFLEPLQLLFFSVFHETGLYLKK